MRRLSPRKLGEVAELVFMARAAALGFTVLRPNAPCRYDLALDTGSRLLRIQVKSTATPHAGRYAIATYTRDRHRRYSSREIDLLAVWVAPLNTWYIIPARIAARHGHLYFLPGRKTYLTERYRESWHLLGTRIRRLPDTPDGQIVLMIRGYKRGGQGRYWL